jgi:hypothetical protein
VIHHPMGMDSGRTDDTSDLQDIDATCPTAASARDPCIIIPSPSQHAARIRRGPPRRSLSVFVFVRSDIRLSIIMVSAGFCCPLRLCAPPIGRSFHSLPSFPHQGVEVVILQTGDGQRPRVGGMAGTRFLSIISCLTQVPNHRHGYDPLRWDHRQRRFHVRF